MVSSTELALDLISKWEGFSPHPYEDVVGIQTIGYGHVILPGEEFDTLTHDEALDLLEADMQIAIECLDNYAEVDLTPEMEAALISFIFNVGCGAFRGSTLLRLLNKGDYAGASKQFSRWNKAGGNVVCGLTNRRAAEAELFRSGM